MADPSPTHLAKCDEDLPLLNILRQFDFGQFVFLHDKQAGSKTTEDARPVVIDPTGGKLDLYREWLERQIKVKVPPAPEDPLSLLKDSLGGVSLTRLIDDFPKHQAPPLEIEVDAKDLIDAIPKGQLTVNGQPFEFALESEALTSIFGGEPTLVELRIADNSAQSFMTQLSLKLPSVTLDESALDGLLAGGKVEFDGGKKSVRLTPEATKALLAGRSAVARVGKQDEFVRLKPKQAPTEFLADEVVIEDLAHFLVQRQVPGVDGHPIDLDLGRDAVRELRVSGSTSLTVGDRRVTLLDERRIPDMDEGSAAFAVRLRRDSRVKVHPGLFSDSQKGHAGLVAERSAADVSLTSGAARPLGLPVAVFLPWRQTWTLTGFSRGELRSSLALAPLEEMTIEVSSWERRLRTLDQSSQTDVEQTFESAQIERDAEDVFREMTTRHDFSWQLEGSVDASYSTGNGSINVSAGGQVGDSTQLQSIARSTQQRMRELTQKSAAKIRTQRTTHITDAAETGSQTRVTRQIKNTNYSHTLTLDFFETLAHYDVTLAANPDRLQLVALLPNPMATREITREMVRQNETSLRRALLDGALSDGFDACRTTRAYENAVTIINEQAAFGAKTDAGADNTSGQPGGQNQPAVPTSQETAVIELLRQIAKAYGTVSAGADVVPALKRIPQNQTITTAERLNGQHWLFLRLCNKYLPGVLSAIQQVPAAPTIAHVGPLVAVIPPPGSATTLANLNDKSDSEKEQAGLGPMIGDHVGRFNWNWSTGRTREESLYTSNDEGLAGLVDRLQRAYEAYLAKQAQGELEKDKDVKINKANADQDKLSTADKLAMAFPLDELSAARERQEALIDHLNKHLDHYCFALFQGLSAAEQSRYIEVQSNGALEVGMFEPRVIAIHGAQLAVPLAPPPKGPLRDFIENLRKSFADAFGTTADSPDTFVFPTPGMSISSRLGKCSTSESYVEDTRGIELRRLAAEADSAEHEASRRKSRLDDKNFDDPDPEIAPLRVTIDPPV